DAHFSKARGRIKAAGRLWLLPLHKVEWNHAIAQHVFRGAVSEREAAKVCSAFEADCGLGLWLEVDMPEKAFETAANLAENTYRALAAAPLTPYTWHRPLN